MMTSSFDNYRDCNILRQRLCDTASDDNRDMETIGERVARLRKELGWTQDDLAKEAGVAQSTINGVEKGARNKMPSSLIEIAHALGVDAYWLKTGTGDPKGHGEKISSDEWIIVRGFRLAGAEVRQEMLDAGRRRIERDAEALKAKAA